MGLGAGEDKRAKGRVFMSRGFNTKNGLAEATPPDREAPRNRARACQHPAPPRARPRSSSEGTQFKSDTKCHRDTGVHCGDEKDPGEPLDGPSH